MYNALKPYINKSYFDIIGIKRLRGKTQYFQYFERIVTLSAVIMDIAWFYTSIRGEVRIFSEDSQLDAHVYKLWKNAKKLDVRYALQNLTYCSEEILDNDTVDFSKILITNNSKIFIQWSELYQNRNRMTTRMFDDYLKNINIHEMFLELLKNLPFLKKSEIDIEKGIIRFFDDNIIDVTVFPFIKIKENSELLFLDKVDKLNDSYRVYYRDIKGVLHDDEKVSSDILSEYYSDGFESFLKLHKKHDIGIDTEALETYSRFRIATNLSKALIHVSTIRDGKKPYFSEKFEETVIDSFQENLDKFANIKSFCFINAFDYLSLGLLVGDIESFLKDYLFSVSGFDAGFELLAEAICTYTNTDWDEASSHINNHIKRTEKILVNYYYSQNKNFKKHFAEEKKEIYVEFLLLLAAEEYRVVSKTPEYPITYKQRVNQIDRIFRDDAQTYEIKIVEVSKRLENLFKFLVTFYAGVFKKSQVSYQYGPSNCDDYLDEVIAEMKKEYAVVSGQTLHNLIEKFEKVINLSNKNHQKNFSITKKDDLNKLSDNQLKNICFEFAVGKKGICPKDTLPKIQDSIVKLRNLSSHDNPNVTKEEYLMFKSEVENILSLLKGSESGVDMIYPKVFKLNKVEKSKAGYFEYHNVTSGIENEKHSLIMSREYNINQRYYALPNVKRSCGQLWIEPLLLGCSTLVDATED